MNTDLLRSFVEVARQQSYSRAAEHLYLGQPTVYHHVKLLESGFGVRLVEQHGKRTDLTRHGMLLLDRAMRVLEEVDSLSALMREDESLLHGQLRLGASTTFGQFLMPWLMTSFNRLYPGVHLEGHIINDSDLLDSMVLDRQLDVVISPSGRQNDGLMKLAILKDMPVLVVPPGFTPRLLMAKPSDLIGLPVVTFSHRASFRQALDAWFVEAGGQIIPVMELGSQEAIKAAILAGAGVSVLSYCTVASEVAMGLLCAIPLVPRLERPWYLVLKSPLTTTHAVEAVLKLLHSDNWLPPTARGHYTAQPDLMPPVPMNGAVPGHNIALAAAAWRVREDLV